MTMGLPVARAAHDIFLAWLLWLPDGMDAAEAAKGEIDRIDRRGGRDEIVRELRGLLDALVQSRQFH